MTYANFCILVVALLPYITAGYAKFLARATFDNTQPRKSGVYTGKAERAYGAHLNSFEVFPFFAVAVLFAEFRFAPQEYINMLSYVFVAIRLLYIYAYIEGWPNIRSALFGVGFFLSVGLFLLPFFNA